MPPTLNAVDTDVDPKMAEWLEKYGSNYKIEEASTGVFYLPHVMVCRAPY